MAALNINNFPIGFLRSDGSIYIGKDIWIRENIHEVLAKSKSPEIFVETLLLAKCEGDVPPMITFDNNISDQELDNLITDDVMNLEKHIDYYLYWLDNIYESRLTSEKLNNYSRADEIMKFREYANAAVFNHLHRFNENLSELISDDDKDNDGVEY